MTVSGRVLKFRVAFPLTTRLILRVNGWRRSVLMIPTRFRFILRVTVRRSVGRTLFVITRVWRRGRRFTRWWNPRRGYIRVEIRPILVLKFWRSRWRRNWGQTTVNRPFRRKN